MSELDRETLDLVYGVHSVTELLELRPGSVERVFASREKTPRVGRVLKQARHAAIPVTYLSRELLRRKLGPKAVHQGVAAQVSAWPYAEVEELCEAAAAHDDAMLLLLDRVVDPQNLGAILRTAAAAGVRGVILSEGGVGLTPAVAKVAAGAVERVPVARAAKPGQVLERLAELDFSSAALDPQGAVGWDEAVLSGRILFVAGGEQRGVRPAVAEACQRRIRIPLAGGVESLNVAVSLGVILFEAVRQRRSGVRRGS